jgi:hypothetical protein
VPVPSALALAALGVLAWLLCVRRTRRAAN